MLGCYGNRILHTMEGRALLLRVMSAKPDYIIPTLPPREESEANRGNMGFGGNIVSSFQTWVRLCVTDLMTCVKRFECVKSSPYIWTLTGRLEMQRVYGEDTSNTTMSRKNNEISCLLSSSRQYRMTCATTPPLKTGIHSNNVFEGKWGMWYNMNMYTEFTIIVHNNTQSTTKCCLQGMNQNFDVPHIHPSSRSPSAVRGGREREENNREVRGGD